MSAEKSGASNVPARRYDESDNTRTIVLGVAEEAHEFQKKVKHWGSFFGAVVAIFMAGIALALYFKDNFAGSKRVEEIAASQEAHEQRTDARIAPLEREVIGTRHDVSWLVEQMKEVAHATRARAVEQERVPAFNPVRYERRPR